MPVIEQLRALVLRHASEPRVHTAIPGLMLFRSETRSVPAHSMYRSRLYLIVQGSKRVILGAHAFIYDDSHYLITTIDLPVRSAVIQASADQPYLALSLDFDRSDIANLLLALPDERAARGESEAGLAIAKLDDPLLLAVLRLSSLLDTPQDIAVLAPLMRQEIYYRLLRGPLGARLRQIAVADSHFSQISQAMNWIKENHAQSFGVTDLAQSVGMSTPSLFRHFKAVALMSPIQYRTQIRLQEARRRLVTDGEDAAEAGFAVGYESPSQFSRDYRRMFGIPPAQDAARMREETASLRSMGK
mgnify:CR=1 FL=1